MAQETIAGPVAFREDTHDGPGPDDPRFVVMAHPSRQKRGKAMWLVPVPGVTLSKDHRYVCSSRQGAGIPDFAGLPCLSGKGRGLHAWEMVRRALAILWPSGRTVSFFPQTPEEGRVDTDSRGAPAGSCKTMKNDLRDRTPLPNQIARYLRIEAVNKMKNSQMVGRHSYIGV